MYIVQYTGVLSLFKCGSLSNIYDVVCSILSVNSSDSLEHRRLCFQVLHETAISSRECVVFGALSFSNIIRVKL